MRVAWFTPLSTESAIAEYSVHLSAALATQCDIDLWAADLEPWRKATVPVIDGRIDPPSSMLAEYDHVIYNFGDHAGFHRSIYDASRRYPGACILHDRSYDNLLAHRDFRDIGSVRDVIAGAVGILVHANDHARAIDAEWFGPVGRIHFPVYPRLLLEPPKEVVSNQPRTLLTFGHVNPNKQVHRVIELLGRDPALQSRLRYFVVGPTADSQYVQLLKGSIEAANLDDSVRLILTYQPDADLDRYVADAHAFVNLREPPSESASASLLVQLGSGKPSIVSDVGYFAEVPDGAVLKVPPGNDHALHQRLWQVATDDNLLVEVGGRAREYAATLTLERAAEEVLCFLDVVRSWKPLLDLTGRVAAELVEFRATPDAPVIGQVAKQIAPIARS